jgi:hypothetical protein
MKYLMYIIFSLVVSGCTYSISQIQTRGTASDVIDSTQSAEPNVAPTLTIPASVLP